MLPVSQAYTAVVLQQWEKLNSLLRTETQGPVNLDGVSLDGADIVCVSRYVRQI